MARASRLLVPKVPDTLGHHARTEDLDAAVLVRVDVALEFPLPVRGTARACAATMALLTPALHPQGEHERLALLRLYFGRYITAQGASSGAADADVLQPRRLLSFLRADPQLPSIDVAPDVTEELFQQAAARTAGFSGRELAKLMSAVQAAVYGSPPPRLLTAAVFLEVVEFKVREHAHKRDMVAAGAAAATGRNKLH